ncbi:MAG: hypothetical protein LBF19_02200 [Prevotellaceae bacterium]|jgi:hypothetical protein|nr:hypothetical protein [Prevotellaceae bacterium]
MYKYILSFSLALFFSILCGVCNGQAVVHVSQISADYGATPPTITFKVYWDSAPDGIRHLDSVWLFVDYRLIYANGALGDWTAASLNAPVLAPGSEGTISTVPSNTRGFYLYGNASTAFSSTVTVGIAGLAANTRFNWCTYASDYPPNAEPHDGYYRLHGSPPFVVNGVRLNAGVNTYSGCITSLTDSTQCPGLIPSSPAINSFTASATTICAGDSIRLSAEADGASSYSFDGGASWITASTSATARVAPKQDTVYWVQVRNSGGCVKSASKSITVYPSPTVSFDTAPSTACAGSVVQLTATGGGSYCFTHTCSECIHNPYSNGNEESTGVDCLFENRSCSYTTANNYSLVMPNTGSVTVCVKAINTSGCTDSVCHVIGVDGTLPPAPTLSASASYCLTNAKISCMGLVGYSYQLESVTTHNVSLSQDGAGAMLYFPITAEDEYRILITDKATSCRNESNSQRAWFYAAYNAGEIQSATYATCPNAAGSATTEVAPSSNEIYQWTVKHMLETNNEVVIDGAVSSTYLPPATATLGPYTYTRKAYDDCQESFVPSTGEIVRVVVDDLSVNAGAISVSSGSGVVGTNSTTATIVESTLASGASGVYTYRWVRESPPATFTTNTANYTFTAADLATAGVYTYYREVRDNFCNTTTWYRSAGSYELTVTPCPYTGSDLYLDATHLCQLRSSGAQNWEAWIQDARDGTIYRIAMLSTNNFWTMDDYLAYASHSAVVATSQCTGHDATGKEYWKDNLETTYPTLCPTGWRLPVQSEFERTITDWMDYLSKPFVVTGETLYVDGGYACRLIIPDSFTSYVVSDCLGSRQAGQRVTSIDPPAYYSNSPGCFTSTSTDGRFTGYVRCVRAF